MGDLMTMQPLETQVEVLRAQVERMQREIDALVNMRRLDVPVSSSPQQTARGRMIYDETKDALTVGTGTGRLELSGATDLTAHTADGDAHHDESHAHDGVDGSGTVGHGDLTGVTSDQHHAQSHGHTGADGSGTVSHANLTGVTSDQHHAQAHAASHSDGGADEVQVEDLATASVDATQVLMPDGLGGVEFAALADGDIPAGIARDSEVTSAISTHAADADAHHNQSHAATHVDGGADEIDGDTLDIDFTPSNYTPDASPAEANDVDDLAAHLSGIDTALGSAGGSEFTVVEKSADETVTSSTTFQDDDELTFAVSANSKYLFYLTALWNSPTAADIKFTFTGPSGAVISGWTAYQTASAATAVNNNANLGSATFSLLASSLPGVWRVIGIVDTDATAGNVTLQWAQNTSNGGNTTVFKGSRLEWKDIT